MTIMISTGTIAISVFAVGFLSFLGAVFLMIMGVGLIKDRDGAGGILVAAALIFGLSGVATMTMIMKLVPEPRGRNAIVVGGSAGKADSR